MQTGRLGCEDETHVRYSHSKADFSFSSWIMRFHTPQRWWWSCQLAKLIVSNLICAVSWLGAYLLSLHICRDVVGFPILNLPHLHDTDFYGADNFATIWGSATKNKWKWMKGKTLLFPETISKHVCFWKPLTLLFTCIGYNEQICFLYIKTCTSCCCCF